MLARHSKVAAVGGIATTGRTLCRWGYFSEGHARKPPALWDSVVGRCMARDEGECCDRQSRGRRGADDSLGIGTVGGVPGLRESAIETDVRAT